MPQHLILMTTDHISGHSNTKDNDNKKTKNHKSNKKDRNRNTPQ